MRQPNSKQGHSDSCGQPNEISLLYLVTDKKRKARFSIRLFQQQRAFKRVLLFSNLLTIKCYLSFLKMRNSPSQIISDTSAYSSVQYKQLTQEQQHMKYYHKTAILHHMHLYPQSQYYSIILVLLSMMSHFSYQNTQKEVIPSVFY